MHTGRRQKRAADKARAAGGVAFAVHDPQGRRVMFTAGPEGGTPVFYAVG